MPKAKSGTVFIGIDPGAKGGMCILRPGETPEYIPLADTSDAGVRSLLLPFSSRDSYAALEQVTYA